MNPWSAGGLGRQQALDPPVQLTRGNDRFAGDAMDYDNLARVMQLRGRVKGLLVPEPAR